MAPTHRQDDDSDLQHAPIVRGVTQRQITAMVTAAIVGMGGNGVLTYGAGEKIAEMRIDFRAMSAKLETRDERTIRLEGQVQELTRRIGELESIQKGNVPYVRR